MFCQALVIVLVRYVKVITVQLFEKHRMRETRNSIKSNDRENGGETC